LGIPASDAAKAVVRSLFARTGKFTKMSLIMKELPLNVEKLANDRVYLIDQNQKSRISGARQMQRQELLR
jgi:hypothetical protein